MSIYNYKVGNYVRHGLNGHARIEKIISQGDINTYEITLLRSYPKDIERKATAKENEIAPIGLWGKGEKFLFNIGFAFDKSSKHYFDTKNKVIVKEIVLDFPSTIEARLDDRILIGLTRVLLYLLESESKFKQRETEILLKAKGVTSEDDLKKFITTESKTSYVHDIQNFYSENHFEFNAAIESAILGF
jgi:hypothetical protein